MLLYKVQTRGISRKNANKDEKGNSIKGDEKEEGKQNVDATLLR